ncbi:RNA polymerase-associated protein RapA [Mycobacterium heckeshornense]|uniref:helicase-related protein n=1 Tax=Mycobacterium heckeshornense TaxID=110505 RepID=UPI0019445CDB|nr:helicase-related protein [Mycobacterium heckeshornense]BCQ10584.1 RNA polymerase-associated protein RapA [Mycobacterium heckeshornense]
MTIDLDAIRPGVVVVGLRSDPVTILDARPQGADALALVFRQADGQLGEQLLYRSDLDGLSLQEPGSRWSFDADAREFQLAAEAMRIKLAGLHDPMLAVSSSEIDPLPHQIRAVYEEMLPRTPLRFLLADDPGAGKTIMAGLYAKELMLRGDVARLLVVAPGGLVEQWQDELALRFGIRAELLTRDLIAATLDGNPFTAHSLLIARMDQLARDEDLLEHLAASQWDLTVIDEAHRMSATWIGQEVRRTRRYELGQRLSAVSRHLLLMTATPHAGSEENYQLFLALLDPDRFEGRYVPDVHSADTAGLMRRMVKEELLTFDGKPLFPERIAETVPYQLSPPEHDLYEAVTTYVRTEMNRADALEDSPRRRTVGFALTVLQRRLASSTHAILRSLQRRRARLDTIRQALLRGAAFDVPAQDAVIDDYYDDELDSAEAEELEEHVVDAATAARTAEELAAEIAVLDDLVARATRVRNLGQDRKWAELRTLIIDRDLLRRDDDGRPRKLIIFTEHRDTLDYLAAQIRNVLGRDDPVVVIHGGVRREDRRQIRERFSHDPTCQVLVATDAAGEGLNLQAAHLMINYDLPWNPNRIEQRFGRIHRIGQKKVCRLWNLVAEDTREGQVFTTLLAKMEAQRKAYGGRLFDVLGKAFTERPLRELLIEAIRYGDDPARMAEFDRVIDAEIGSGLKELAQERALARETLTPIEVDQIRRRMDEARGQRLQPHFIENFFLTAFAHLGGRMSRRETDRFEITHVPAPLRVRRRSGSLVPVTLRYERVTFEPAAIEPAGAARAELLAPGHPLLDAVLDEIIERHGAALDRGTVLVDDTDTGEKPKLLIALTAEIVDGTGQTVSKKFAYVSVGASGAAVDAGAAPYLDAHPITGEHQGAVRAALRQPWLAAGVDAIATTWAVSSFQPEHLSEVRARLVPYVQRTKDAVRARLLQQINYLSSEAGRLREEIAAGTRRRIRVSPERMEAIAEELDARLAARTKRLELEMLLSAKEPRVVAAALILPAGMLSPTIAQRARDTAAVERRAVDAVLAAERRIGRQPIEMAHTNKGYDIASARDGEPVVHIEVKGRLSGADTLTLTYSELIHGKNMGAQHRLALVEVSPDGPEHDRLRYVADAFARIDLGGLPVTDTRLDWAKLWAAGSDPF